VTLVTGGAGLPEGRSEGFYLRPTVFLCRDAGAEIARAEVFGPVLAVLGYGDDNDLIALANGTDYGLAAAVWGSEPARIEAIVGRLRAGQIDVNGAPFNPRAPFGGFGHSGSGREMGRYGIREFLRPVSIQRKASAT
jgi:acyl-CoA reductase-like NAD-dependent aldehyde dehydrogenase